MSASNADILAAWLIHAHRTDPSAPLMPTDEQISEILKTRPGQWFVAHAVAEAFVKQVQETEPKTALDTFNALRRGMKGVHNLSQEFGGIFSAPPVSLPKVNGK